ncbi:unnamed protein product [Orchesella dallaii]|uniref:Uncharacterized protein n=1 Tax=Orchesella dallaii TaxID=48710 RepID=A0ABP1R243_9HEXA
MDLSFNLEEKAKLHQQIKISSGDKITLLIPEIANDTVYIDGVIDAVLPAENFLNTLNNAVSLLNSVVFSISYDNDAKIFVKVKVNMANNGFVVLDATLVEILGFDKQKFTNGQHIAKVPFNEELLEATKHSAENKYIKYVEKQIDIVNPSDDSLDAFCEALYLSFRNAGEEIFVTLDQNENFINFDIRKDYLEFMFPKSISDYLRISSTFHFTKQISIQVPESFEEHSFNHVLCCSNLIDYQAYGSSEYPIIRLIDIGKEGIKGHFCVTFPSVNYYPLLYNHFKTVSTTFIVRSSKYDINLHPSTAVLHIRKK